MLRILVIQDKILHYRKPLYNALSELYDVTVLHSGDPAVKDLDEFREIVVPVRRFGSFLVQSKLLREVRIGPYDVVIVMFDLHWISGIVSSMLPFRTPTILWGHRYSRNTYGNYIRDFLMKRADAIILYGHEDIDAMLDRGIPPSKIFVAPNTIHVENYRDFSSERKNSFLFVGRAQKRKRVHVLIRAFHRDLHRLPQDTVVNIIGDGDENTYLKELAKSLGLNERVIFHGELNRDEQLSPYFQSAYAYVSPGPVGLSVLHSFAYGVPVVTSKSGKHGPEFRNLVHGVNSVIYDSDSDLGDVLVYLANIATERERLGSNAYNHYTQTMTLGKMIDGFVAAIEHVIDNG